MKQDNHQLSSQKNNHHVENQILLQTKSFDGQKPAIYRSKQISEKNRANQLLKNKIQEKDKRSRQKKEDSTSLPLKRNLNQIKKEISWGNKETKKMKASSE